MTDRAGGGGGLARALADRYLHLLTAVLFLSVGAGYLWLGLHVRVPPIGDPLGPRLFPLLLAVLFLVFSTIFLVNVLRRPPERSDFQDIGAQGRAWAVFAMLVAFVVILPLAGFPVTTAIFVFFTLSFLRFATLSINLIAAVVIAAVFHLLFRIWLGVPLPDPALW